MGKYFNWKNGTLLFGKGSDAEMEDLYNNLTSAGSPLTQDYIFNSDQGLVGGLTDSLVESLFGESAGSLNLGQSLKSWLDSMSGSELTNAQKQMNDYNSTEAQINREFQAQQAELAYERQVDFYEQYQSLGAQMRQYEQAGLNPALMYGNGGSVSSSAPSSSSPSGSQASGSQSNNPMALVSFVMQLAGIKSQIDKTKAETENIKTDTDLKGTQITATETEVEWRKKNIEVMDNEIRVGDSIIEVNASQFILNEAKAVTERLTAQQVQEMLPLLKELTEAQTAEAEASAALKIAEAVGVTVHAEVEQRNAAVNERNAAVNEAVAGVSNVTKVVDTVVDSVDTAVTTGMVIADIVGEVFGVESLSTRFDDVTTVKDKNGKVVRTVERKGHGSRNGTKSRKRRRR